MEKGTTKRLDPMQDKVRVQLPRATGKEEDFIFVGLNGKGYTIRRGVSVMVPRPVYEILAESQRQADRQAAYLAQLQAEAEEAQRNPRFMS